MLRNLPGLPPSTPPLVPASANVYILPAMDLVALNSSPPSGTQLRDSNRVFNESISTLLSTPTRSYAKRMTTLVEKQTIKVILLERELNEARELAQKRKKRTGKRIKLEGEFIYRVTYGHVAHMVKWRTDPIFRKIFEISVSCQIL